MKPIACQSLSAPGGINFRRLTLEWFHEEDISLTMALAERYSHTHTLEFLHITRGPFGASIRRLRSHR